MKKIDIINLGNNNELLAQAKNYDDYYKFKAKLGWQDWMMYLVGSKFNNETGEYEEYAEDEKLSEFEIEKINDFLKEIWEIAHQYN